VPIIRIQNLNSPNAPFNYYKGHVDPSNIVENGDLLVSWSASLDAYIWNRGAAALNQHIFKVIENIDLVTREYLYLSIRHAMEEIRNQVHGATMRHITKPEFEKVCIPVPPIAEQMRLSKMLREQMSTVRRARAAAEAQLAAATKLAAAHLRALFSDVKTWPSRVLGDVGTLLTAKSISTNGDAEVSAVTTACLTETGFDERGIKTARMRSADFPQCILRAGEILIARSNTPDLVGRVAVFPGLAQATVASDLTIRLWCNDLALPQFVSAYLSYLYLAGYWKERAGGASGSMKKITRPQILSLEVPLPARDEQRMISERLERKMGATLKFRSELQSQAESIEQLPAALLRAAFSGEL